MEGPHKSVSKLRLQWRRAIELCRWLINCADSCHVKGKALVTVMTNALAKSW
jgi:hypothetical protein